MPLLGLREGIWAESRPDDEVRLKVPLDVLPAARKRSQTNRTVVAKKPIIEVSLRKKKNYPHNPFSIDPRLVIKI